MEEIPEEDKTEEPCGGDGLDEHVAGGKRPKLAGAADGADDVPTSSSPAANEVKEENVDSGISGDKSEGDERKGKSVDCQVEFNMQGRESDSTERRELPGNSLVNAGPSSSSIAWVLSIKKPMKSRNYRKHRNTLSRSTDSDDSQSDVDSDDISMEEAAPARAGGEGRAAEAEAAGTGTRSATPRSEPEHSDSHGDHHTSQSSNSDSSDMTLLMNSHLASDNSDFSPLSSDTDELDNWTDPETAQGEDNQEYQTPSALLKPKPKHSWFLMKELLNREMGLTVRPGRSSRSDALFEQRYYGSLHSVYRLELMYKLDRHRGCVNSINFHPEGHLLASGSDDLSVVVWDWATGAARQVLKTGHKSNVFQSRFMHLNSSSQLNIVTCARDGQIRLLQCPPSGGSGGVARRRLAAHTRSAHKLHVSAAEPHLVLSCGEDGQLLAADVRADRPIKIVTVKEKGSPVALFSIHGHPLEPRELLVAGRNRYVRVYDRRKPSRPLSVYCPANFSENVENASKRKNFRFMSLYATCAVYNHDGSEILVSYNDDDIYLFDALADRYEKDVTKEGYTHRYSGHRNSATFKGVAFFGPRSEFVVSGSDCSYIYVWDKKTEAIVQWMLGDEGGVVNCIESHPRCPILASSGLDQDVKIWVPSNERDPLFTGLKEVVKQNSKARLRSPLYNDVLPTIYSAWNRNSRDFSEEDSSAHSVFRGNIDFDGQVCTTF